MGRQPLQDQAGLRDEGINPETPILSGFRIVHGGSLFRFGRQADAGPSAQEFAACGSRPCFFAPPAPDRVVQGGAGGRYPQRIGLCWGKPQIRAQLGRGNFRQNTIPAFQLHSATSPVQRSTRQMTPLKPSPRVSYRPRTATRTRARTPTRNSACPVVIGGWAFFGLSSSITAAAAA